MGKLFVRATIVAVALYFILAYLSAQFLGIDILDYCYANLFEFCVLIYTFSEGKYHCKFIKWTMLSIFLCDTLNSIDIFCGYPLLNSFNFICIFIMALGIGTSTTLAFRHFYKVRKLQRLRNGRK